MDLCRHYCCNIIGEIIMSKQKEFPCNKCGQNLHWGKDYEKGDRPLGADDKPHDCPKYQQAPPIEQPKPQPEESEYTRKMLVCPLLKEMCAELRCAIWNQDIKQCGLINLR